MNLLIDIGNTSAKIAVAHDKDDAPCVANGMEQWKPVHFEHLHESWNDTFTRLSAAYHLCSVRIANVGGDDDALCQALEALHLPVLWITPSVSCPVKSVTGIPLTFGADRWAADIGAIVQDSTHTLLIVDIGTCVTYDLLSHDGCLLGTAISPGISLRLKAMHEHTARLPLLQSCLNAPLWGDDTPSSMRSAAFHGLRFEVEGYVRSAWREHPDLHVFFTGGDKINLADDITCQVTHDPYLVFRGLQCL